MVKFCTVVRSREGNLPVYREIAAVYKAHTLRWLFLRPIHNSTVERRERAEIFDGVFAFLLRHDLIRDHRLCEATTFGHHPRENVREVCLGLVFGTPFTTSHHLPIPPFPNSFESVLLQSLLDQAEPTRAGFADSSLNLRRRAVFAFKPMNFSFEVEESRMLRDRSFFSNRKFVWKAVFVEFSKGVEIVYVIILCWLIEGS